MIDSNVHDVPYRNGLQRERYKKLLVLSKRRRPGAVRWSRAARATVYTGCISSCTETCTHSGGKRGGGGALEENKR